MWFHSFFTMSTTSLQAAILYTMYPVPLLKHLDLLQPGQRALDVGAGDLSISAQLVRNGLTVDAIDVVQPTKVVTGVNFQKISVEKFLSETNKTYDIVIARHVLHQVPDPDYVIDALQAISRTFVFTCFGAENWLAEERYVYTQQEILERFPSDTIRHRSETFQYSPNYAGKTVFWHVHSFAIHRD